ncbi:hypothetical protein [Paraburkholderia sp. DGU8]|jgi:hypothetical protein|uniref:hypothetical protein n=1 Tax=Paraburkholderia sp. DGU8 TaxID=3161997 RepID=UPI0034657D0F
MTEKTENYRGYVLVARPSDFGARCWAWKDNTPVHKMIGGTANEAILAARRAIDEELGTPQRQGTEADVAYTAALAAVLPSLSAAQGKDGTPIYTFALADEAESDQPGDIDAPERKWKMLPAHALRALVTVSDR